MTAVPAAIAEASAELQRVVDAQRAAAEGLEDAEVRVGAAETDLADCDDLETAVALGEISAEAVAEDRARANRRLEEANLDIRRHSAVLEGIEERIRAAEIDVSTAQLDDFAAQLVRIGDEKAADLAEFRDVLTAAVALVGKLTDARGRESEILKHAAPLAADLELEPPRGCDEPEFRPDAWPGLVAVLTTGPSTPVANHATAKRNREAHARDVETRRIREIAQLVADYGDSEHSPAFRRLPELDDEQRRRAYAVAAAIQADRQRFVADQDARIRAQNEALGVKEPMTP